MEVDLTPTISPQNAILPSPEPMSTNCKNPNSLDFNANDYAESSHVG